MEAVLSTFITPIVQAEIHGDCEHTNSHTINLFTSPDPVQHVRVVLRSAAPQLDLKDSKVMVELSTLKDVETRGRRDLPPQLSVRGKQHASLRKNYDDELRGFIIYHLTSLHSLPSIYQIHPDQRFQNISAAITLLDFVIRDTTGRYIPALMQNRYLLHKQKLLSLEILFQSSFHQWRNEITLLERLCPDQGYNITFDPSDTSSRWLLSQTATPSSSSDDMEFISRVQVLALKYLSSRRIFSYMRVFAWNDWYRSTNTTDILSLINIALSRQRHVKKMARSQLFAGDGTMVKGTYTPPAGTEKTFLVLHSGSSGSTQDIETEDTDDLGRFGSVSGVIGSYSSVAASLKRERADLCDRLYKANP